MYWSNLAQRLISQRCSTFVPRVPNAERGVNLTLNQHQINTLRPYTQSQTASHFSHLSTRHDALANEEKVADFCPEFMLQVCYATLQPS